MGSLAKIVFLCPFAVFFLHTFDLRFQQEKTINSACCWKNILLCHWKAEVNVPFIS